MEKKQNMDVYFAVFNCHVNNAKTKAVRRFNKKFGKETFNKEIRPFIKNGIMSMFHTEPNKYTKYFAETIQEIVNQ